jgi:2-iminobutanoate/2-iminopropanoate deaminase
MAGDIQSVAPQGMAAPGGHYRHAVKAGGLVFLSGQLPIAADGTPLVEGDFATQVRQVFANLAAALLSAGSTPADLVQVRVYVTDINDWPVFDTLYAEWIGGNRPARAVVPVQALHHGFRIEIEGVAQTM